MENSPSEAFIHVSAEKCWEMVRERINQEISKRRKLGVSKLPHLQPRGSLNGMEMFGFSSPFILQVIFNVRLELLFKNLAFVTKFETSSFEMYLFISFF